jgi:hypothetical protein
MEQQLELDLELPIAKPELPPPDPGNPWDLPQTDG